MNNRVASLSGCASSHRNIIVVRFARAAQMRVLDVVARNARSRLLLPNPNIWRVSTRRTRRVFDAQTFPNTTTRRPIVLNRNVYRAPVLLSRAAAAYYLALGSSRSTAIHPYGCAPECRAYLLIYSREPATSSSTLFTIIQRHSESHRRERYKANGFLLCDETRQQASSAVGWAVPNWIYSNCVPIWAGV